MLLAPPGLIKLVEGLLPLLPDVLLNMIHVQLIVLPLAPNFIQPQSLLVELRPLLDVLQVLLFGHLLLTALFPVPL